MPGAVSASVPPGAVRGGRQRRPRAGSRCRPSGPPLPSQASARCRCCGGRGDATGRGVLAGTPRPAGPGRAAEQGGAGLPRGAGPQALPQPAWPPRTGAALAGPGGDAGRSVCFLLRHFLTAPAGQRGQPRRKVHRPGQRREPPCRRPQDAGRAAPPRPGPACPYLSRGAPGMWSYLAWMYLT